MTPAPAPTPTGEGGEERRSRVTWPDGWSLEAWTERIEITRDGSLPPYGRADTVRRFMAGEVRMVLVAPDGWETPMAAGFTQEDIDRARRAHDDERGEGRR